MCFFFLKKTVPYGNTHGCLGEHKYTHLQKYCFSNLVGLSAIPGGSCKKPLPVGFDVQIFFYVTKPQVLFWWCYREAKSWWLYLFTYTCTCWRAHKQINSLYSFIMPYHSSSPWIFTLFMKFAWSPADSYHYHFTFDYRRGWELEYYFMHLGQLLCCLLSSYFLWYQRQRGSHLRKSKRNAFRIFCFHFLVLKF